VPQGKRHALLQSQCAYSPRLLWSPLWPAFALGQALSQGLVMPTLAPLRASRGGVLSMHHTSPSALGPNASGSAVVAFLATPKSLTLAVPLVETGAVFASNDASPGSCASMATHSRASALAFPAAWTGPRPTPPGSSRGSSHNHEALCIIAGEHVSHPVHFHPLPPRLKSL
jgi:hypothetical protein